MDTKTQQNTINKKYDVVIFHGPCSDGVSALWCSDLYLKNVGYNYEPIQCRAGSDPEGDFKDKRILFVDLCPSFQFIIDNCLNEKNKVKKLTILDHHKSAIDMYRENESVLQTIDNLEIEMDPDRAGCQIAWDYFFEDNREIKTTRPWFIDYVGDRDLWKWLLPNSKEINAALFENNLIDPSNLNKLTDLLTEPENKIQNLLAQGKIILQLQKRELDIGLSKALITEFKHKEKTYKIWLGGNISMSLRSELGNLLVNKKFPDGTMPDFAAIWVYDPKSNEWWISFRGGDQSPDLSIIARELGGGGHGLSSGTSIKNGKTLLDLFKIV
jgi:oligoribonuclease NrnB/cAMP/cGMP phosphodiesterase (DHH superfamily)